jgi:hypothetical protein
MNELAACAVVSSFNECINAQDIEALSAFMTDDHRFIDTAGATITGKSACLDAWRGFFTAFPDYRISLIVCPPQRTVLWSSADPPVLTPASMDQRCGESSLVMRWFQSGRSLKTLTPIARRSA